MLGLIVLVTMHANANDFLDQQKPDNISDNKWRSLKAAIINTKLLPSDQGIEGESNHRW